MTSRTMITNSEDCEPCTFCSSRYNRTRPSFCQCKHCSVPLCFDCTKEHHDELLQTTAHLSHHYNQLQELLQSKQSMIVEQTTKTTNDVNRYFDTYINELRQTQRKIIQDLKVAKQDGQNHVDKMKSDLQALGDAIQALTKEGVVQTAKMNNLSTEMKKMEEHMRTYQAVKVDKLIKTQPELSMKFECPPVQEKASASSDIKTNKIREKETKNPATTASSVCSSHQALTDEEYSSFLSWYCHYMVDDDEDPLMSDNDDDCNITLCGSLPTSYHVNRMASDGEEILYTSYRDQGFDFIAYRHDDYESGSSDDYREWKQPRIKDMIWWCVNGKYICATSNGIYTVDHGSDRFKTQRTISGNWSYIRVAANFDELFLWMITSDSSFNGIQIYSPEFKCVRVIDFEQCQTGSFIYGNSSFCVTDEHIASICKRKQNNRDVFQAVICDMNMNKLKTFLLGECNNNIEIRADINDQFFITTGRRQLHIISFNGHTQTIELEKNGGCISILDDDQIAVSCGHIGIEVVDYRLNLM